MFAVSLSHANDSWSWKHHNKMREQERLQAHLVKQINESGSKKVVEAVVETRPTASKVGSSMLKRVNAYAKAPGVQAIGVYAVVELLEAIGWVMKDGTYVKIKETDPGDCISNSCPLVWFNKYGSPDSACKAIVVDLAKRFDGYEVTSLGYVNYKTYSDGSAEAYCKIRVGAGSTPSLEHIVGIPNPDYVPENPKPITHTLTPALLGAAMLGQGYSDPADSSVNDVVNTGRWTGVPEAYTPDSSGIGNELANELAEKANNAKPTHDGKASSFSDPRYQDDLSFSDKSNDRTWTDEKGTTGESSAVTDPATGETKGNFKLPAFCDWASAVCDWFDWTKEEPELEDEPLEIEDKEIISYQREDHIQFGQTCPFSPQTKSLPLGVLGSLEFETDLTFICTFGSEARPYVLGIGHLGALIFLLIGLRNGNA